MSNPEQYGEDTGLDPRQEKALMALLTAKSITAAADASGVPYQTLRRWLAHDTAFRREYRTTRHRIVDHTIAQLMQLAEKAVDALRGALDADNAAVRVRAAHLILEHTFRGAELLDLDERIGEIEAILNAQQTPRPPDPAPDVTFAGVPTPSRPEEIGFGPATIDLDDAG